MYWVSPLNQLFSCMSSISIVHDNTSLKKKPNILSNCHNSDEINYSLNAFMLKKIKNNWHEFSLKRRHYITF